MVDVKSQDPYIQIIVATLSDVQTLHSEVFTRSAYRKTAQKVIKRYAEEGTGFLTKTLPRLAKALDRALTGEVPLDCTKLAFKSLPGSKLPKFLGELFQRIFAHDGWILPTPCAKCVKSLRQILLVYYKLELPHDDRQEHEVLEKFERTEQGLVSWNELFSRIREQLDADPYRNSGLDDQKAVRIIRSARILLAKVFEHFDHRDIHPRHGPGVVSTKETLSGKYTFRCVSPRTADMYPIDAYYYASMGHVCDVLNSTASTVHVRGLSDERISREPYPTPSGVDRDTREQAHNGGRSVHRNETVTLQLPIELRERSARVILVPKDSRGPRLISCEPLEFQWIQQGLGRAIVQHLESHPLTRWSLHFSEQNWNQNAASYGSITGSYATLDLNEASDRVCTELVRLLFPEPLSSALMACRSLSTVLPDGRELKLNKYAPMGSALCFPVLATVCWALLAVGLPDAGVSPCDRSWRKTPYFAQHGKRWKDGCKPIFTSREDLLVYGDDIIVQTAQAAHAIDILEAFGLVINRAKSCTSGFFRESCGRDAFRGVNVTPVRIRTVWSHHIRPDVYTSYIATANHMYEQGYHETYDTIVRLLLEIYQEIPDREQFPNRDVPVLITTPEANRPKRMRTNPHLQKRERYVWSVRTPKVTQETGGWNMLLRFFAERTDQTPLELGVITNNEPRRSGDWDVSSQEETPFSVRQYTRRDTSYLVKRWR